jgi:hypothetical protein
MLLTPVPFEDVNQGEVVFGECRLIVIFYWDVLQYFLRSSTPLLSVRIGGPQFLFLVHSTCLLEVVDLDARLFEGCLLLRSIGATDGVSCICSLTPDVTVAASGSQAESM